MNDIAILKKTITAFNLATACIALTACGGESISTNATTPEKAQPVRLVEKFQRVKKYDCAGKLISDSVETISEPTLMMNLIPNTRYHGEVRASHFKNSETLSSPALVWQKTKFEIDYYDNWTNMWVRSGQNEIVYSYIFDDGTTDTGKRYIDVSYDRVKIPGESTTFPNEIECENDLQSR